MTSDQKKNVQVYSLRKSAEFLNYIFIVDQIGFFVFDGRAKKVI